MNTPQTGMLLLTIVLGVSFGIKTSILIIVMVESTVLSVKKMSDYYVMMALHGTQDTVMYPFLTEEEMMAFKGKADRVFNDTYCDDCERVDIDDIRDESHE